MVSNSYGYIPNLPANIVGCVLFGILLILQIVFGLWTRDWWMWVSWVIFGGLEVAGYIARAVSHKYIDSEPLYEMQLVCLILGPAFMAAGLYYQLAKQVTIYGQKYSVLKPMMYNAIFTTCDVVSLVVQAAGGGYAAANVDTDVGPQTGGWIMVAGIAFQVLILVIFIIIYAVVNWRIYRDDPANYNPEYADVRKKPFFKWWVPAVCVSLLFLLIRSAYRIAELSEGWTGHLMRTERYFLVLDGLMTLIGMIALTVVYPGFAHGFIAIEGLHFDPKKQKAKEASNSTSFHDEEKNFDPIYTPAETAANSEVNDQEFRTPPPN